MAVNKVYIAASDLQTALDRLVDEININLRQRPVADVSGLERRLRQIERDIEDVRKEALAAPPSIDEVIPDPTSVEVASVEETGAVARVRLRYYVATPVPSTFTGVAVFGQWAGDTAIWDAGGGDFVAETYSGSTVGYVTVEISQPAAADQTVKLIVVGRSGTTVNQPTSSSPFATTIIHKMTINVVSPPVAPASVGMTGVNGDDPNTWGVSTTWAAPSGGWGGTVSIEVQLRYYDDAAATTPTSDWIGLGSAAVGDGHLVSGFWPRPTSVTYVKVRARGLNAKNDVSAWVEASGTLAVSQHSWSSGPPAPTAVSTSVVFNDNDSFGFVTTITDPANTADIEQYEVQARYWLDAALTQPDSDWILLGYTWPGAGPLESGYWPRPTYNTWVKVRVRSISPYGARSAWVESAAVAMAKPGPPNSPSYVDGELVPVSDTAYSLRVFFGHNDWRRTSHVELYAQFYTDAALATKDGEPRLLGTTSRKQAVSPYIYPMEEFGPWPRNVADRWVVVGAAAVGYTGERSSIVWAATADKIDKVLTPPPATSVSATVTSGNDSGVATFGFSITVTLPANTGTTKQMAAEARFWNDAALTSPDSDWIPLGSIDLASPTLVTDQWPRPSTTKYAKVRVATENLWGVQAAWVESAVLTITPGDLDLGYSKAASVGPGLQVSAGKLQGKLDTAKFAFDGSGQITTASSRDLPVIAGAQPGSTWLGSNVVYYNGHVYTWTGSAYVPDASASWVKQQLQSDGLTAAEFASGFAPVRLYSGVPASYVGDFVVDTSARKLLRWTGSAYARPMPGSDIKAELQVDKLTAAEIAAGAITTTQLAGNEIQVGPVSGLPPRFIVKDSSNVTVAAVGEFSGFTGLWAANGRFGGTFASPTIDLTSTSASINNATLTVSGTGGYVSISPSGGMRAGASSASNMVIADSSGVTVIAGNASESTKLYGDMIEMFKSNYKNVEIVAGSSLVSVNLRSSSGPSMLLYVDGYGPRLELNESGTAGFVKASNFKVGTNTVIDSNRYVTAQRIIVGTAIMIDENNRIRYQSVLTEAIPLAGITTAYTIPAHDANGLYIGKIPVIP